MPIDTVTVQMRWLDLSGDDMKDGLLADALVPESAATAKDRALARLGVTRADGEGHLAAYLRTMHEENGLPYSRPAHPAIRDAVDFGERGLSRFVWWLA